MLAMLLMLLNETKILQHSASPPIVCPSTNAKQLLIDTQVSPGAVSPGLLQVQVQCWPCGNSQKHVHAASVEAVQ
jgi:hypothetical protein